MAEKQLVVVARNHYTYATTCRGKRNHTSSDGSAIYYSYPCTKSGNTFRIEEKDVANPFPNAITNRFEPTSPTENVEISLTSTIKASDIVADPLCTQNCKTNTLIASPNTLAVNDAIDASDYEDKIAPEYISSDRYNLDSYIKYCRDITRKLDSSASELSWESDSDDDRANVFDPSKESSIKFPGIFAARVSSLSLGAKHSCGIVKTKLYCWGQNTYGQLGTGDFVHSSIPIEPRLTSEISGSPTITEETQSLAVSKIGIDNLIAHKNTHPLITTTTVPAVPAPTPPATTPPAAPSREDFTYDIKTHEIGATEIEFVHPTTGEIALVDQSKAEAVSFDNIAFKIALDLLYKQALIAASPENRAKFDYIKDEDDKHLPMRYNLALPFFEAVLHDNYGPLYPKYSCPADPNDPTVTTCEYQYGYGSAPDYKRPFFTFNSVKDELAIKEITEIVPVSGSSGSMPKVETKGYKVNIDKEIRGGMGFYNFKLEYLKYLAHSMREPDNNKILFVKKGKGSGKNCAEEEANLSEAYVQDLEACAEVNGPPQNGALLFNVASTTLKADALDRFHNTDLFVEGELEPSAPQWWPKNTGVEEVYIGKRHTCVRVKIDETTTAKILCWGQSGGNEIEESIFPRKDEVLIQTPMLYKNAPEENLLHPCIKLAYYYRKRNLGGCEWENKLFGACNGFGEVALLRHQSNDKDDCFYGEGDKKKYYLNEWEEGYCTCWKREDNPEGALCRNLPGRYEGLEIVENGNRCSARIRSYQANLVVGIGPVLAHTLPQRVYEIDSTAETNDLETIASSGLSEHQYFILNDVNDSNESTYRVRCLGKGDCSSISSNTTDLTKFDLHLSEADNDSISGTDISKRSLKISVKTGGGFSCAHLTAPPPLTTPDAAPGKKIDRIYCWGNNRFNSHIDRSQNMVLSQSIPTGRDPDGPAPSSSSCKNAASSASSGEATQEVFQTLAENCHVPLIPPKTPSTP